MDALAGVDVQVLRGVLEDAGFGFPDADLARDVDAVELTLEAGAADLLALHRAIVEVGDQSDGTVSAGGRQHLGPARDRGRPIAALIPVDLVQLAELILADRDLLDCQAALHPLLGMEPERPLPVVVLHDPADHHFDRVGKG